MGDADGTAGTEVDYENTAGDDWQQQALGFYQNGQLQVKAFNTKGVVSAQVWGTCPRCRHGLDIQMTLSAPVIGFAQGWRSIGRRRRTAAAIPDDLHVGCGCGLAHDRAPKNVTGCGVSFSLPTAPPAS